MSERSFQGQLSKTRTADALSLPEVKLSYTASSGDRTMKKALGTIFCAALTLLAAKASAYMMALNEQLDHAIYSRHDPKLIVAGHIAATDIRPRPPVVEDYPAERQFSIHRHDRHLGPADLQGADSRHSCDGLPLAGRVAGLSGRRAMRARAPDGLGGQTRRLLPLLRGPPEQGNVADREGRRRCQKDTCSGTSSGTEERDLRQQAASSHSTGLPDPAEGGIKSIGPVPEEP